MRIVLRLLKNGLVLHQQSLLAFLRFKPMKRTGLSGDVLFMHKRITYKR
jgi:hypothetical protein